MICNGSTTHSKALATASTIRHLGVSAVLSHSEHAAVQLIHDVTAGSSKFDVCAV